MKWKCDSDSKKDRGLYEKQRDKERFHEDQPERSKREDHLVVCKHCGDLNEPRDKLGRCFDPECYHAINGCGALNIVVTQ